MDNRPRCSVCGSRLETGSFKEGYIVTYHRWPELETSESLAATKVVSSLKVTDDTGSYHHEARSNYNE